MNRGKAQNAAGNAPGATAAAPVAASGGKPKRAKAAAKPKAKKAKGTLVSGLLNALPDQPGPWLARCIEKWALTAPYDPSVSETQWEQYFKERAALEWHTNCVLKLAEGEDDEAEAKEGSGSGGGSGEPAWPFDWPEPALSDFARESYGTSDEEAMHFSEMLGGMRDDVEATVAGCTGVAGAEGLARSLADGLFICEHHIWDDVEEPRDVELSTRLYSPCTLATSLEFSYTWHRRTRAYYAEHFCSCNVALRGAGDANADDPQAEGGASRKGLFGMSEEDSGYQERSTLGVVGLNRLAGHLLGRKGQLSVRKMLVLSAVAAGVSAVYAADESWVFREARRKHELGPGEEDEGLGGEDSDNGELEYGAPQYPDPFGGDAFW